MPFNGSLFQLRNAYKDIFEDLADDEHADRGTLYRM